MSAAKVSDRIAKKRLLELANFLENDVPSEHFDFRTFGSTNGNEKPGTDALAEPNLCGTKACALGWAPALPFAKRLGYKLQVMKDGSVNFTRNGRAIGVFHVAKALFGLKSAQADMIFFGSILQQDDDSVYGVARGIRTFVQARFG